MEGIMTKTWILVADGARARLFEAAAGDSPLAEVECFANPEGRAGARRMGTGPLPRVHESVGPARHAIEPHTTAREKVTDRFARILGEALERGRSERRYERLVLVAPPRFLGALHDHLGARLRGQLAGEIRRNLTALPPAQIRSRLPARFLT
jgi:protein required for attachment to host cells